ncbi:MAG: hypothetical protein K1Y02_14680 [Candidatus Hydrogenedentes bacterium]|nr:hypothetical protein [Candidatus Hydrogenedentota bacterium]
MKAPDGGESSSERVGELLPGYPIQSWGGPYFAHVTIRVPDTPLVWPFRVD